MFPVKEKPVASTGKFVDRTVSFDRQEVEVMSVSQTKPPTTWMKLRVPSEQQPVIIDAGLVADLFKKKGNAYELASNKITIGIEAGKVVL